MDQLIKLNPKPFPEFIGRMTVLAEKLQVKEFVINMKRIAMRFLAAKAQKYEDNLHCTEIWLPVYDDPSHPKHEVIGVAAKAMDNQHKDSQHMDCIEDDNVKAFLLHHHLQPHPSLQRTTETSEKSSLELFALKLTACWSHTVSIKSAQCRASQTTWDA